MQSKLSHRLCLTFSSYFYDYLGIRFLINMHSKSSFIIIFVLLFLQIFTESKAASISRDSGVRWETSELQPVQDANQQDTSFKNLTKKLFQILNEMQDLIDLMPADDANVYGDSEYRHGPSGSATAADSDFQQRLKQEKQRALNIYTTIIWNITHANETLPPSQETLKDNPTTQQVDNLTMIIKERQILSEFAFRPRMMSIYPLCNNSSMDDNKVPNNSIDLIFDLNLWKPSHDVIVNVTSAILRIYKRSVNKDSYSTKFPPNKNVTFLATYYKSPHHNARRNQNKTGMKLGKQTFCVDEERWTEWDIKKAVSDWYNNPSRNNGVTIKVADDQIRLPAREFFNIPINCSYITEWPSLPPEVIRNSSYAGISVDLPFLDMTVKEVPKAEVKFIEKEQELVKEAKQHVNTVYNTANSSIVHEGNKRKSGKEQNQTQIPHRSL